MVACGGSHTAFVSEDNTVCLVFSKEIYEEIISNSSALIGKDINDNTDWSKFEKMPLFKSANRMNAYNTYLLMEQEAK